MDVSDEDDWETKLEKGEMEFPTVKEAPAAASDSTPSKTVIKEEFKKADKMQSFDDILCFPTDKAPVHRVNRDVRPETTAVVARRFLAHALQKPELIRKKEEAALTKRREERKRERAERRKDLDAVWDE